MKIDNGTGGNRETSTGGSGSRPGRSAVDERGRESTNFFAELKRRNVYKVAVAYAVVAWLLLQAASIFLPAFDAPLWVMKIFIVVIIFGFPVALIFSWTFEIRRRESNERKVSIFFTATADGCMVGIDEHACRDRSRC